MIFNFFILEPFELSLKRIPADHKNRIEQMWRRKLMKDDNTQSCNAMYHIVVNLMDLWNKFISWRSSFKAQFKIDGTKFLDDTLL